MYDIVLSRLRIIEYIHLAIPKVVLLDIANAHGIKYRDEDIVHPNFFPSLIKTIYTTKTKQITLSSTTLPYLARYINKYVSWNKSSLLIACQFLEKFTNKVVNFDEITDLTYFGPQTPEHPLSLNACMLYKLCLQFQISVNSQTSLEQMHFAITMLRVSTNSLLRRLDIYLTRTKRNDIINILASSQCPIADTEYEEIQEQTMIHIPNFEILQRIYSDLSDVKYLQKRILPTNEDSAIALAAINYGIDLSKATQPVAEYSILNRTGRMDYRPKDIWMQKWYKINPSIFDLAISFNPIFPSSYYHRDTLNFLVIKEGFDTITIRDNDHYELLQLVYVSDTFYTGEFPNLSTRETPVDLLTVEEIPIGELLSYGSLSQDTKPISVSELLTTFEYYQNFTNPFDNTLFSDNAIAKLMIILESDISPVRENPLSIETIKLRKELRNKIDSIRLLTSHLDEKSRDFLFLFQKANNQVKKDIKEILYVLLDLSMYMRGWKGFEEYPVKIAIVSSDYNNQVELNVTKAMQEYERLIRANKSIGVQINELPLVEYKDGKYFLSKDRLQGYNIRERLEIVKQGSNSNNVNSCIRISSNWLCASAHRYLTLINEPAPFDIFNMRKIS